MLTKVVVATVEELVLGGARISIVSDSKMVQKS